MPNRICSKSLGSSLSPRTVMRSRGGRPEHLATAEVARSPVASIHGRTRAGSLRLVEVADHPRRRVERRARPRGRPAAPAQPLRAPRPDPRSRPSDAHDRHGAGLFAARHGRAMPLRWKQRPIHDLVHVGAVRLAEGRGRRRSRRSEVGLERLHGARRVGQSACRSSAGCRDGCARPRCRSRHLVEAHALELVVADALRATTSRSSATT